MAVISRGTYCPLFRVKSTNGLLIATYGLHRDAEQENFCINKNHVVKVKSL